MGKSPGKLTASPRETLVEYLREHEAFERIIRDGFCEIAWPSVRSLTDRVKRGYWRLLDRDNLRHHFEIPSHEYDHDELGNPLEIGLLDKRKGAEKKELTPLEIAEGRKHYDANKCVFHYNEDLLSRLRKQRGLVEESSDIFGPCAQLNIDASHIARAIGALFDEKNAQKRTGHYPGSFAESIVDSLATTRLLRYERPKGKVPDASPHRDRCAITVHWISSHPGLGLFAPDGRLLTANETDPEKILIFPGQKFWGATRGIYGTGTLHGVLDRRRMEGKRTSRSYRFVAVTFVHSKLDPETVAWMTANWNDLRIDPDDYKL